MPYKIKQINELAIHDWLASHEKDIARMFAYVDNKNSKYNDEMIRVESPGHIRVSSLKIMIDIYSFNRPIKSTLEELAIALINTDHAHTDCIFIPMQSWELLVVERYGIPGLSDA